jgi:hypothetical protein
MVNDTQIYDYIEQNWGEIAADVFEGFWFIFDGIIDGAVDYLVSEYFPQTVKPLSWNHAKIVAVNGRALLTGGGNYYDLYNSTGTLIDNDMTILGDAAITAHGYADYLWQYVLSLLPQMHFG